MIVNRLQSQILAALLVFAAIGCSALPSHAATNASALSASQTGSVITNDTALAKEVFDLLSASKFDEALATTNNAIQSNPNNATAYVCKASVLYYKKADVGEVIAQLNIAINLAPNYLDARYLRGCMYEVSNDLQSAVKDFDFVIAQNPADLDSLKHAILDKFNLKDYEGMLTDLNLEIQNNPQDGEPYFERAYCECLLGQTSAAVADLKQAQTLFVAANDADGAKAASEALKQIQA